MWHLLIDKVEVQSATTALAWLELVARREVRHDSDSMAFPSESASVSLRHRAFCLTQKLARVLHSLVRVLRWVR